MVARDVQIFRVSREPHGKASRRRTVAAATMVIALSAALAHSPAAAVDADPPTVTDISVPRGVTGPAVQAYATVRDASGINKVYLYIDQPDGRNAAGLRMWDDGAHGDLVAGDDRYSVVETLDVRDGSYAVSLLTYDGKYNQVQIPICRLSVSGPTLTWTYDSPSPTPSPSRTPSHVTVTPTSTRTRTSITTRTQTKTPTRTRAPTRTQTKTPTRTRTPVPTPTRTPALPPAPTRTPTPANQSSPTPARTNTATVSPTTAPTAAPQPSPPPGPNLLANGSFEAGLTQWEASGAAAISPGAYDGLASARLSAAQFQDARLAQVVSGLKPRTRYTLAVRVRTSGALPSDVWASYGVEGDVQLPKTNSVQSAGFKESRFSFYTADKTSAVLVWLLAGRNDPPGDAYFDSVRLVEGLLPVPEPAPGEPALPTPLPLPSLPPVGDNIVTNGTFDRGEFGWVVDGARVVYVDGNPAMAVTPADTTARAIQDLPLLLAPDTDYLLEFRARSTGTGATVGFANRDGSVSGSAYVTSSEWRQYGIPFRTAGVFTGGKITAEFYKGNTGTLFVDDIVLAARGGEWLDTPNPVPSPGGGLFESFDANTIDNRRWLLANKAWGGDNGGVVPQNVSVRDGVVRLEAHGDRYGGPILGLGGRRTRVGAAIVTRDYYASGRYEVRARVPRQLGACSAFWIFHYLEYQPGQPEYYEEPSRIRNSEIDWEFPTARDDGTAGDEVTFDRARANAWGGKFGGEGGNVSLRPAIGQLVADGQFHDYVFDWHSGGEGVEPAIVWSIDGIEVARTTGAAYGQDNIPFRAARFWIGIWFPASGYRGLVGWAGNPDFDTAVLEIDSVRITPFGEPNDAYVAETWPNGYFATPDQYPAAR